MQIVLHIHSRPENPAVKFMIAFKLQKTQEKIYTKNVLFVVRIHNNFGFKFGRSFAIPLHNLLMVFLALPYICKYTQKHKASLSVNNWKCCTNNHRHARDFNCRKIIIHRRRVLFSQVYLNIYTYTYQYILEKQWKKKHGIGILLATFYEFWFCGPIKLFSCTTWYLMFKLLRHIRGLMGEYFVICMGYLFI